MKQKASQRVYLLMLLPVVALAPLAALVRYLWAVATNPGRAWGIARAFDRVFNVAANGDERETVSSRAARARDEGRAWGCVLCRLLDRLDAGHCDQAKGV
ncbi:hypothetical protein [Curvibacter gracilis]|uniref:hypothetical protein n=1 Tax=Curvibacter gracilis TaxID=230310 RepID=UPI0004B2FF7D|nr:hypothetical protein [Curvibacter gracilis]